MTLEDRLEALEKRVAALESLHKPVSSDSEWQAYLNGQYVQRMTITTGVVTTEFPGCTCSSLLHGHEPGCPLKKD